VSALARVLGTQGRGTTVFAVWAAEALVAWSFATALGVALAGPLTAHPDGVFALYGEGGRILFDYLRREGPTLELAGGVAAVLVALWALAGVLLGGVIPWVAASRMAVPTVARAFAESLRRAPTLLALALLSLLGYGLVALFAWQAWAWVDRATTHAVDVRAADLRHGAVVLAALLLASLVRGWHAVARFQALGKSLRALSAAAEAAGRLAREPLRTLGRGLCWSAAAGLGTLVAFGAGAALERNRAVWAVLLLTAVQQLSIGWRVHCRMKWYVGLGGD
jgi:hypothetical protein